MNPTTTFILVIMVTHWSISNASPSPSNSNSPSLLLTRPLNVQNTSAIVEKMLAGYQVEIGPLTDGGPVAVKVQVLINDMMGVSETDMHVSTDFYLRMEWIDKRFLLLLQSTSVVRKILIRNPIQS